MHTLRKLSLSVLHIPLLCTLVSCVLHESCAFYIGMDEVSTESPNLVETFDPHEWNPEAIQVHHGPQIKIESLRLETKIRLRYARTRIVAVVYNPYDKPMQASFKINLPDDAFFTIFKLKRVGLDPILYTASIMDKETARNVFHYAHIKTNGTVSAGIIELWNENSVSSYNLKFTLGPKIRIESYLVYETLIQRMSGVYRDMVHFFPLQPSPVEILQFSIDVQELERIKDLRFSEGAYATSEMRYNQEDKYGRRAELSWTGKNVASTMLYNNPFKFQYELDQQNTSSAVVIGRRNGNVYFVHLFVPQHLPVIRKHIMFLLDVSDSMHGNKLDQLKWAMREILDDIAPHDFFSIITFSNDATVWSKFDGERKKCPVPFPGTEEYKDSARYFIKKKLSAHGRTNVFAGISQAFDLIQLFSPETNDSCQAEIRTPIRLREKLDTKLPNNVESMIFFLSDGVPTSGQRNPRILLNLFHQINHRKLSKPVPIYTIAFGEDADRRFLKTLSSQNGGITKVIPVTSAADLELADFYGEISSPVLSRLETTISVNGSNITQFANYESPLLLLNGTELITAGQIFPTMGQQIKRWSSSNLKSSTDGYGTNGKLSYSQSPVYDCQSFNSTFDYCMDKIDLFLERLQAYNLLKKLIQRDRSIREGYYCPKSVDDEFYSQSEASYDYDENEVEEEEEVMCVNPYKDQIIELATKYKFVTRYTSFILCSKPKVDRGLNDMLNLYNKNTQTSDNLPPQPVPKDEPQLTFEVPNKLDDNDHDATEATDREQVEPAPKYSKLISLAQYSDVVGPTVSNISEESEFPHHRSINTTGTPTTNNGTQSKFWSKAVRDIPVSLFKKLFSG